MTGLLDAALAYAARGWRVLPLRPRTKIPATAHGLHDATTDEETIRAWWDEDPARNVGVATGAESGIVVADLDDAGASAWWREQWPGTLICYQRTGRGEQVVLRHPGGQVRNSASRVHPGVDIRGDGGYVVAPPSVHPSGAVYEWVDDAEPAAVPPALEALLAPPARSQAQAPRSRVATAVGYGARALEYELEELVCCAEGARNHRLNVAAFNLAQLVAGGVLDLAEVEVRLAEAADRAGLRGGEISRTIASGISAGLLHPRGVPDRPPDRDEAPPPEDADAPEWVEVSPLAALSGTQRPSSLTCYADVVPREVRWIWPGRIPRGMVSVIAGLPGSGKTTLALDIVASVSEGRSIGGSTDICQGACLVITTEDDEDTTLVPRLAAAGARLGQVRGWPEDSAIPGLPDDAEALTARLLEWQIRVMVVDPMSILLGTGLDSHKDSEVRKLYGCLRTIAKRADCAIIGIAHLNKSPSTSALSRVGGSGAWVAAARSVLLVHQDPDGDQDNVIVAVIKCNLCRQKPATRLRRVSVGPPEGAVYRYEWTGEAEVTADQLLTPLGRPATARSDAEEWISRWLSDGPQYASDTYTAAEADGISAMTLKRAKRLLGVKSTKTSDGRWVWAK